MEITHYKKIKDNLYEIIIDNNKKIELYDETIIKYSLLTSKSLNHKFLDEINNFNDNLKPYYLALKYMNKKMKSTLEVEKYLQKKEFSKCQISIAIQKLKEKGYLNNKDFITSYINDQINLTYNGPEKIKYNLIKLGFKEDEINIEYDFNDKIKLLITKKIKLNHKYNTNTLKQNIAAYLINLGYSKDMFVDLLDNISVNDDSLIKKDYESLLKKYSKKYDKYKLMIFIKDKLYRKGYSLESINNLINEENL